MKEKLLHTPDGVRDIYNSECKKKLKVQNRLHHVLELYSYHDIQTPTFEFFDIFNRDKGSAMSTEMYKFFDRDNNTLVLRPDFTPSVARCVSKYYSDEELPIRLCYSGSTFVNGYKLQGKLKEISQIGAELINDDSSAADAETIATVVECFLATGLKEFQIEVGQVDYFKGIIEQANIDEDNEDIIRNFIENKNFFGLSEYIKTINIDEATANALNSFSKLFGGIDMLKEARDLVTNSRSIIAVERMNKVYSALCAYGYEKYVSFDLGMLSRYNYYTGIIFRGYTYGTGDAVVKGGRYNNLLEQFGKCAPSIGFAIFVDELMLALSRQKIEIQIDNSDKLILYSSQHQKSAIFLGSAFRKKDMKVQLIRMSSKRTLEDYKNYGKNNNFSQLLYFENEDKIKVIDFLSGDEKSVDADSLLNN